MHRGRACGKSYSGVQRPSGSFDAESHAHARHRPSHTRQNGCLHIGARGLEVAAKLKGGVGQLAFEGRRHLLVRARSTASVGIATRTVGTQATPTP